MQNSIKNIDVSEKRTKGFQKKESNGNKIHFAEFDKNLLFSRRGSERKLNDELFGRKLKYTISKGDSYNSKTGTSQDSVYIPQLLNVSINGKTIETGTEIFWNPDPLNKNGVAILMEYNAINQEETIALDNPKSIRRSFVVADTDGSYQMKLEDFNVFPNNSYLTINVMRAGFNSDDDGLSVIGMTNVGTDLKVMK